MMRFYVNEEKVIFKAVNRTLLLARNRTQSKVKKITSKTLGTNGRDEYGMQGVCHIMSRQGVFLNCAIPWEFLYWDEVTGWQDGLHTLVGPQK